MKQDNILWVNDQLVDLFDQADEPIQLTFTSNNLGDIASVSANYSKGFNVPLTKRNKAIFGFPDDVKMSTRAPYKYYRAKLQVSGIDVIPAGKLQIMQVNNSKLDVFIISGNADFMDLIGYQIVDMGDSTSPASGYGTKLVWKPYDHAWSVQNAAYSQSKTSGWIWPALYYGTASLSLKNQYDVQADVRNLRPAFFLKTAFELLVQSTGYQIDEAGSCLYNDAKYSNLFNRLLVPWSNSNFAHGVDFANSPSIYSIVNNPLSRQLIHNGGDSYHGIVPFNQTLIGPFPVTVEGTVNVTFVLTMTGISTGAQPSEVRIYLTVDGVDLGVNYTCDFVDGDGSTVIGNVFGSPLKQKQFNGSIRYDAQLAPGSSIAVNYYVQSTKITNFVMNAGAQFTFEVSNQNVLWGQPVQCERILPDMSQLDLFTCVLRTFALLPIANPNTGTLRLISFKQVIDNVPLAKDWTSKCIDQGKQINFNLGNYAQQNWFRYPTDSTIPVTLMPRFFADDNIPITDETLSPTQPKQDIYVSPFSPSLSSPIYNTSTGQMADPTATDDFNTPGQPRLLIDQKIDLRRLGKNSDGSMKKMVFADAAPSFDSGRDYAITEIEVNDWISMPYFYKEGGDPTLDPAPRHLCWCDKGGMPGLKSTYYTEFEHVLEETKKVVRYFMLTPRDIAEFDPAVPVYLQQDNAYYYINKIDSWQKNLPCKVELIRL